MARFKKVEHGERVELTGHLDELRTRVLVSVTAFGVALGLCFWQNHLILAAVNVPLHGKQLLTLGVAEPFTTTLALSAYAGILLALPVLLYQAYAFVLPAFSKRERRVALPLMLMVPVLFVAGAAFAFFVVVPAALQFLLHFNADQFQTQLRAKEYYSFLSLTMIGCGIVFQVPVGVLALTRLGVTNAAGLRAKRRYAWLGCAVVAAALPGVDPVTMLFEMVPLVALYELSIVLAALFGGERVRDVAPLGS
ncbi:MAG: sec-independent protein translocase protein TatC [Thermoleophilaceae bacterium]|nr:sec-independent protein translocase protein TatC [Thermoleophilaceae bacterium]